MRTNRHRQLPACGVRRRSRRELAIIVLLAACAEVEPMAPLQPQFGVGNTSSGKQIFRFETFRNEGFWTDTLELHTAVQTRVSPQVALAVGLKVDASDLPRRFLAKADLTDPATTVELLRRNAVVGVKAEVEDGRITRLGITCALCHSTVDNSVAQGIGKRLDGWANPDLDVGAIVALSPKLTAAQRTVYESWLPGRYDPRFSIDGINGPVVIPPAYGLQGVALETYTGDGPISYWNAYVAVTQMHGQGVFIDERIGVRIVQTPDLVTPKLAALRAYQHSLPVPPTPGASYDRGAANRGRRVFEANCIRCHFSGNLTDNNNGVLHAASETGMDSAYAARTIRKAYRTTPLRGLWQHPPYFHDGSAKTLKDVVEHYNRVRNLNLSGGQKRDLVEYLKSL